jgi:hypothetical protein
MTEPQGVQVPPGTDAKALVAAILDQAAFGLEEAGRTSSLRIRLTLVRDNATRLAALLNEQGAEREELVLALAAEEALQKHIKTCHVCKQLVACDEIDGTANMADRLRCAALARVKGKA